MTTAIAGEKLRSFIERLEAIEEERRALKADMDEIFAAAEQSGFEVKIMRKLMRERRVDEEARAQEQAMLDLYRSALGMLTNTPLGDAATKADKRRSAQEEGPRPAA